MLTSPVNMALGCTLIASYVTRCGGVITSKIMIPAVNLVSIYILEVKPNDSSINPIDR